MRTYVCSWSNTSFACIKAQHPNTIDTTTRCVCWQVQSLFYVLPIDIRRILMHFQVWKPSPLVTSDRNKNALLPLVVVSQKIGPSQGLQVNYGVLATDSAPDR